MRLISGLLGAIALAGLSCPAYAAAPPPGTYRQSCTNIRMQGSTLTATCRSMDGRRIQTALGVARCSGDIGNNNGQLQCNGGRPRGGGSREDRGADYGYGEPGYGRSGAPGYPPQGEPGYPRQGYGPPAGYGSPPGYGPPPGYGDR